MKFIFSILLGVFTMLLCVGCSKKLQPTVETVYRDSLIERKIIVPRDTIVYLPGEEIYIIDSIPCPDYDNTATSKSGKLKSKVVIKNGVLTASCKQDSLQKVITLLNEQLTKEKYSLKTRTETKFVLVDKLVKYTPRWHWYLHLVLLGLIIWIFRTPILSFIKHIIAKWN